MDMDELDEVEVRPMIFEDRDHVSGLLKNLNRLRRSKKFCDVVLQVGNAEIYAHKNVLACASPYLLDLFNQDSEFNNHDNTYKLNGGFEKDAVERLVEYCYTASLEVPAASIASIYMASSRLKMARATKQCGEFLIELLSADNCIGFRSIPGLSRDTECVSKVDNYIQHNINLVRKGKEFLALPMINVEILQGSREEISATNDYSMCMMILDWTRNLIIEEGLLLFSIAEKVHMLYLNADNTLHDCNDIATGDCKDSDLIQDYKKMSKNSTTAVVVAKTKQKKPTPNAPAKPRLLLFTRSDSDNCLSALDAKEERDWKVIAHTQRQTEPILLALMIINGQLAKLSIAQRLNTPHSTPTTPRPKSIVEHPDSLILLPPLSSARCAVGTANFRNRLLVCGGYDRAECLKTVQLYDPSTNVWEILPHMLHSRGRFQITVIGNKVFAVGGSDGAHELASAECFDWNTQKWKMLPPLPLARSHAGVCSFDGKVVCIGGWNGQFGIKRCDMFSVELGTWSEFAKLRVGRHQAGVCSADGYIYVVGGTDSWNCLTTVEKYDPEANCWDFVAPLNVARRGCGVTVYNGKIYAVGGSDGSQSLCSVEKYDPATNAWIAGPNMTSCRANVGVAVVAGRLFAVGGFTGKTFLNSIEVLDDVMNEWTTCTTKLALGSTGSASSDVESL